MALGLSPSNGGSALVGWPVSQPKRCRRPFCKTGCCGRVRRFRNRPDGLTYFPSPDVSARSSPSNDGATMNAQPEEPVRSPPLEGVRILDMSRLVVGNMMTHVLADMGADVIKIEPPEGDSLRAWKLSGVPVQWRVYCRNKRSLVLDLKSEPDRTTLA